MMNKLENQGIETYLNERQPVVPTEYITDKHISIYHSFFVNPADIQLKAKEIFGLDIDGHPPTIAQIRIALIMAQDALMVVGHRFGLRDTELNLIKLPSSIQLRKSGLDTFIKKVSQFEQVIEPVESTSIDDYDLSDLISPIYIEEQKTNGHSIHKKEDPIQSLTIKLELLLSDCSEEITLEKAKAQSLKRLKVIGFLSHRYNNPPIPTDSVLGWFRPKVAESLIDSNIYTLGALLNIINHKGWHWYQSISGLGQQTAKEIHQFIQKVSLDLGEAIHPFAQKKRSESSILVLDSDNSVINIPSSNDQVLVRKTAVTPLELFALPTQLTGEFGKNRDSHHLNKLSATNDYEAILEWLSLHEGVTKESYKKEAERLLLWVIMAKRKPMSSLTSADFVEYKDFLSDPQPYNLWVANKRYPRSHPNWKPFTGKLSRNTISYSFTVINALFEFLVSQQYLQSNPVRAVPRNIRSVRSERKMDRLIPNRLWNMIDKAILEEKVANTVEYRTAFLIKFIYLTGLRLDEIANVKLGDFYAIENDDGDLSWRLKVIGKGSKERQVIIVDIGYKIISEYLLIRDLPADPRLNDPQTYLISPIGKKCRLSNSRIYISIKDFIFRISVPLEKTQPLDFQLLNKISTHWIRHTFASRLAKNAELSIVMKMLGHSNLQTTSIYVQAEDKESEEAMESAFGQ